MRAFCAHTGQPEPADPGAVVRCILESLALKHAQTIDLLASVTGVQPREIHVVGGGARNELLCRWTADAAGLPVLAGPEEATLLGNLLVQAMALGEVSSLAEGREVIRASVVPTAYEPQETSELAGGTGAVRRGRRGAYAGGRHVSRAARNPTAGGPVDGAAAGSGVLEALVYRSNLLGADRALANHGGGNTSSKGTVHDHAGREQRVLWVKGSGTDLATIAEAGFAALRLDEILPLRERESMDDATMVDHLLRCGLAPASRGRRSRRSCTPSSRRRTSTTRIRTRSSR